MKRSACGIAFLGDFWHARGSLKVIPSVHTLFSDWCTRSTTLGETDSQDSVSWSRVQPMTVGLALKVFMGLHK